MAKKRKRVPWIEIKREYITQPDATHKKLAKKYKVAEQTITDKAAKEHWTALKNEITKAAEQAMVKNAQLQIKEMKERHIKFGKLLQKLGLEAIEKGGYKPKSAKEARQFIAEGVRLERDASGASRKDQWPAIVNVIHQERDIIGQYVEDVVEGEVIPDGKKSVREEGTKK